MIFHLGCPGPDWDDHPPSRPFPQASSWAGVQTRRPRRGREEERRRGAPGERPRSTSADGLRGLVRSATHAVLMKTGDDVRGVALVCKATSGPWGLHRRANSATWKATRAAGRGGAGGLRARE